MIDIQNDYNLGTIVKAANRLADPEIAEQIYSMAVDNSQSFTKTASSDFAWEEKRMFPVNTPENAILSKVYFDYQHEKMASETKKKVGGKLDAYINLYNIPEDMFETVQQEKTASDQDENYYYLLPSMEECAVRSKEELVKAGEVFEKEAHKLSLKHRVEFAQEFSKVASELEYVPYPETIAKYAGILDTDMAHLSHMLELRSAAAKRSGQDGTPYMKLAHAILQVDEVPEKKELKKLAETINDLDELYGLDDSPKVPDAFGIVFNKTAEDSTPPEVDKGSIVAQYGLEALEAVELPDGTIDTKKLNMLKSKYGK